MASKFNASSFEDTDILLSACNLSFLPNKNSPLPPPVTIRGHLQYNGMDSCNKIAIIFVSIFGL